MVSDGDVIATTVDPAGRTVVLLVRIWNTKLAMARPELEPFRDDVLATVESPDHQAPDPHNGRLRYYRRHVGPSRWLVVVVSYEQEPARIITAFASRKDPPTWTA